jgi:hypothetical protein
MRQKKSSLPIIFLCAISAISAVAIFFGACASPNKSPARPKPGSGIAEYRELVREAYQVVGLTVESLEALEKSGNATNSPALARFDRALEKLELTSFKTRSRAEAIIGRGQNYFDEWKAGIAASTNQAAARVEGEHYNRLLQHFDRIQQSSGAVRSEFQPFMQKLRLFRAALGKTSQLPSAELIANGHRVLDSLNLVNVSLNDADKELQSVLGANSGKL